MYANLKVAVQLSDRIAVYGARSVEIRNDQIIVTLDAGEGEESPGFLSLTPDAKYDITITADY